MTVISRVGELDQALREIAALHTPAPVEIEWFHEPESSCPPPGLVGCPGHFRTIQLCTECGETSTSESDGVAYREWPCPTIQRIRSVLGADVA